MRLISWQQQVRRFLEYIYNVEVAYALYLNPYVTYSTSFLHCLQVRDGPKAKESYATTNATEYPYGYERQEVLQRGRARDDDGETEREENLSSSAQQQHQPDLKETFSIGPEQSILGHATTKAHCPRISRICVGPRRLLSQHGATIQGTAANLCRGTATADSRLV